MHFRRSIQAISWLLLSAVAVASCSSSTIVVPELTASPPTANVAEEAALFRELLYAQCDASWSREDFAKTVLVPDAALYSPRQDSFESIIQHFAKRRPEEFLRNSIGRSPKGQTLRAAASVRAPLTLIVIPGLSAEAASGNLFPEAIDASSSAFARQVSRKFAGVSRAKRMDRRYSLADLDEISVPLDHVVRAGSLDDEEGRAIVQVVYLHSAFGSLESYGKIEDRYQAYKRRLDTFFRIIGPQKRIYIAGHSRGAAIGIDFLSRVTSDASAEPWVQGIDGFISLNGALFGSHYANAFFDPRRQPYRAFHQNLSELRQLEENAGIIDSIVNRHKIMASLLSMGSEIALDPHLRKEEWSFPSVPLTSLSQAKAFEKQIAPHASYFGDYPRFIRRIKTLVGAAETAIRGLTHESRLAWWATHTIPPKLRYLTLSSTMASPVIARRLDRWQAALLDAPAAGRNLIEYPVLRAFYNGYYDDAGVAVNDGLIGAHEGSFWPQLHQKLNPRQEPYRSTALALFGSGHLSMVYANVVGNEPDKSYAFPRRALLLALAQYLDLQDAPDRH